KRASGRLWRLLAGQVCASLRNASVLIRAQCSGSAALSKAAQAPSWCNLIGEAAPCPSLERAGGGGGGGIIRYHLARSRPFPPVHNLRQGLRYLLLTHGWLACTCYRRTLARPATSIQNDSGLP